VRCKEGAQIREMLIGTVCAIRSHPRVTRVPLVPIVIAMEGMGGESTLIPGMFDPFPNVVVMTEMSTHRYGVPKNQRTLSDMITVVSCLLWQQTTVIPEDAVAFSTSFAKSRRSMRDYREILARQFSNFRYDRTGKANGKAHGSNDDLVIAFMMSLFWMFKFCNSMNDDYMRVKRFYGPGPWAHAGPGGLLRPDEDDAYYTRLRHKR
jgi:hypothetical protein